MKRILLFFLLAAGGLAACNQSSDIQKFIPGTYVNYAEGEFSIAYDTLVIQADPQQKGTYRIQRKSAYQRIEGDSLQPKVHKKENWTARYNAETGSMQETRHGKVITFYPKDGILKVEKREYQKID